MWACRPSVDFTSYKHHRLFPSNGHIKGSSTEIVNDEFSHFFFFIKTISQRPPLSAFVDLLRFTSKPADCAGIPWWLFPLRVVENTPAR